MVRITPDGILAEGAEILASRLMQGMLWSSDFHAIPIVRLFFLHGGDFFFATSRENLDKDARFFPRTPFQLPHPR
jgi:hypothetical protein